VRYRLLPHALLAMGVLLVGVLLAEVGSVFYSPFGFALGFIANIVSSLLFVGVLVGGGYWLLDGSLSPARFRRIAAWTGGGLVVFVLMFAGFTFNAPLPTLLAVSTFRWAATVGAGCGLLVGLFEARAIDRAVAAEGARVRFEEMERQNERLEEFASIISHDLRNPLNVADGYLELVREDYDDERLEQVADAHDRMSQIIEETLTLARQGQVIDDAEPVDLATLAEDSWNTVDTGEATLEITDTTAVRADPTGLRQLFENLFRNSVEHGSTGDRNAERAEDAVEHGSADNPTESNDAGERDSTDERGPGAGLTVRVGTTENGFYVADDGPGIPPEERERVLEPGYTSKEGGTGFGLPIVARVVDAHGWELRLADSDAGGARFEVTTSTAGVAETEGGEAHPKEPDPEGTDIAV